MKTFTPLALVGFLVLLASPTIAQNLIAVQNGGTPTFYEKLEDAISNAVAKDTIYIPGGVFQNIPENTLTINKELHLIGAGHHPDSTSVTNPTYIMANIVVVSGASKSSFEGFYLTDFSFIAGSSALDEDVDEIIISRCNIGELRLSRYSTSWNVHENIIRGIVMGYSISSSSPYAQNNLFSNNIFGEIIILFGIGNQFRNNIFLANKYLYAFESCFFENNIFFTFNNSSNGVFPLCTFNNNLFIPSFSLLDNEFGSNNISNQNQESIFVNLPYTTFNYAYDYHLQPSSPGKNAGTDGTDIGIYGGLYPWKVGSVPTNPHIQFKQVSGTTDSNGNLHVKIKVAAQDY